MEWKKDPYFKVEKLFLTYSEKVERTQQIRLTGYGFNWAGKDHKYDGKVHLIDIDYNLEKK
jgi:hypothetical protein